MRRWLASIGATCALAGVAFAQQSGIGPAAMPGQIVSNGFNLKPAGTQLPRQTSPAVPPSQPKPAKPIQRGPIDLAKGTVKSFLDDDCMTLGAALAYYTVFSLAPLLVITIAIVALVLGQKGATEQVSYQLRDLLGEGGATETVAFNTYLVGFKDFRMSYASALSYLIVGGVLVLTLVFMWIQRHREARAA